ncbi:TIGR00730 family Rossman fold protein [Caulobacter sp. 17J80-11]|uniref:LOG family protein n=1 Tax=Caulobacter sp. 17J80-11 TaxID=2763502 RepID=UPI001653BDC3|nr:TIGR00730 family Rossman fold protein [Caulobacter sp. 17J80-11]MBC6981782.1 TIGR00730 family Rossman fold protein [Caulobacter sp. 17J80-11]
MTAAARRVDSVCLYCGSSNAADPDFIAAAAEFGKALAEANVRLVYGGGGIGLMGAAAEAAHTNGGRVLGVMPDFLRSREMLLDDVETVVVRSMHERKMIMFEQSDAFVVFPGGIGTLEEIVELLSWRRLDLHAKPVVFVNLKGFWDPFFALMEHTIEANLTPAWFRNCWTVVDRVDQIIPVLSKAAEAA